MNGAGPLSRLHQDGRMLPVLAAGDVECRVSEPTLLSNSSPLGRGPCVYCGLRAGAGPVVIAVVIDYRDGTCHCGGLTAVAMIAHEACNVDRPGQLAAAMLRKWRAAHDLAGDR